MKRIIMAILIAIILFLIIFIVAPTKFNCRSCNCTENQTIGGVYQ